MDIFEKNEEQCRIFCYNIRSFRRRAGLSRKEMAGLLRIDLRTLRQIECGKVTDALPIDVIIRSAKLFGAPPSKQLSQIL